MNEFEGGNNNLDYSSGGSPVAIGEDQDKSENLGSEGKGSWQQASFGDGPQVVDVSGIWNGEEERADLSKFQRIAAGFFAQTMEPALTINVKTVGVNAAAARLFPDVDYMEILVNPEEKEVAFKPCDELNISGYKWARDKDGKRYATTRTGLPFVLCICKMMGWNPDNRYRILGKKIRSQTDEEILLFDLRAAQEFKKPAPGEEGKKSRSTILTGWNGSFGPTYDESEGSLHMETFNGFTVMSIKDKKQKLPEALPDKQDTATGQSEGGEES